jgi:serine/threonine-protein kinase mTOR
MQTYGPDLAEAYKWCTKYQETRRDADLHQAWDLYYHIFRRINKNLPTVLSLDLKNVSSTLYGARDLELAMPGTYSAGEPVVAIQRFAPTLQVWSPPRAAPCGVHGHCVVQSDVRCHLLVATLSASL